MRLIKAGGSDPEQEAVLKTQASMREAELSKVLRGERAMLKNLFREFRRLAVFIETDVAARGRELVAAGEDIPMDEVEAVSEAGLREALAGMDL